MRFLGRKRRKNANAKGQSLHPLDSARAALEPFDVAQGRAVALLRLARRGLKRALKMCSENRNVPQRLKPHYKQDTFGTAKAVPLSKNGVVQHPLKPRFT